MAFPTDSRLLEIVRYRVVKAARTAKAAGISLKQTLAGEGKSLRWRSGVYARVKRFKRLRRVLKRQRTVLGIVMREVRRKMVNLDPRHMAVIRLNTVLARPDRLRTQPPKGESKLYAMTAPEVECIGEGKAKQPYEFDVKASIALTR
jgi:IS5 family transposase